MIALQMFILAKKLGRLGEKRKRKIAAQGNIYFVSRETIAFHRK